MREKRRERVALSRVVRLTRARVPRLACGAGDIAVAFFVLGAPIALLVGALTDTFNRRNLFVAVIVLGEGPCLATAYVRTYGQLFAMRALTGISIGGSMPLLYSLLGDLVPPARRSAVSAGVGIAQGAGIAVGQVLAGYLGSPHGWRCARRRECAVRSVCA